jgi:hypothetical protein
MEEDLNFLLKEDNLNVFEIGRQSKKFQLKQLKVKVIQILKMKDDLKKILQTTTIKSKINVCGTAPGNLVM